MKLARLVPVVALAALVGCSPSPSTAADVAGTAIPASALTSSFDGCASLGFDLPKTEVLRWLVIGEAAKVTAQDNGVALEDAEISQVARADQANAPLMADEGCAAVVEASAALNLLATRMDPNEVVATIMEMDITVNPRFGEWSPSEASIGGSGSLSVPS